MILDVLSKEDCEQVRIWRNQSLETLRTPYPLAKEMQEDFYRDVVCDRNSKHRYWAIRIPLDETQAGESLIGMGGLTFIEWENSQAEISLIIDPALRRQGHGEKAVHLLLDQAFNYLNLDLVYGECYGSNPTREFWEKVTKAYNGRITWLRKGKFWKGTRHETMYFDVARDDFRKAR